MARVAAWVGTGVFTAGLSAAVLAGAGAAHADDDSGATNDNKTTSHSDTSKRPNHRADRGPKKQVKSEAKDATKDADAKADTTADKPDDSAKPKTRKEIREARRAEQAEASADRKAAREERKKVREDKVRDVVEATREVVDGTNQVANAITDAVTDTKPEETKAEVRVRPRIHIRPALAQRDREQQLQESIASIDDEKAAATASLKDIAPDLKAAAATPAHPDPLEAIHDAIRKVGAVALNPEPQHYPTLLSALGDVIFDTLATLERAVGGDPVVPPALRDSVQVSTSTLVVSEGHEVESNWYFPTTAEGQEAPTRMIYLQHGFLANGPLYSYTASYLAARTNSIVVTTTFTSNPFEADGMWLGGDKLHESVAQLFLDPERTALNTSMDAAEAKAGRAENITVPEDFVLVGHSLGGGFGPGVAGYYAEGLTRRREAGLDGTNHLDGVVTYDAVPMGSIIPDAMGRLHELETNGTVDPSDDDPNDYIPIYEIGAPLNYLNVFSDVNAQLTQARPGQFTGVVLKDGVHMDPMQGGNPLIQAAAYLIAGFPQPQNPLAVRELSVGWINDMFDEKINPATGTCESDCAGLYGDGDDSFTISTPRGDAVAYLIGSKRATDITSLHNISVTDFITALPANLFNGFETTCELFTGGKCSV